MSLIGVECNADKYFFGRLLNDKKIIRKEKNDTEVIRGIIERSKDNFSIGIIDIDKNKKIPVQFELIIQNENTQIFKHERNSQFLILIGPRQFEHWINEFLKIRNCQIEDFGFNDFNEFLEHSKTISPAKETRFTNVMNYVLEHIDKDDNHILKLKNRLEYLLKRKYQFDSIEFSNIG